MLRPSETTNDRTTSGAGRMASRMDVGTRNSFFAPRLTRGGRFAHFFPVAIQSAFTKLRDMMVSIANRLGGWDDRRKLLLELPRQRVLMYDRIMGVQCFLGQD